MAGRGFYVNFKVPEIQQALNNLSSYDTDAKTRVEEAIKWSAVAIQRGAVGRITSRSGYLKKHTISSFDRKNIVGAVRAKAPHAHLVEFGAKAVTVRNKKARAMHIGPPGVDGSGLNEFAGKVDIPKRAARPFMRPAFEDEKPNLIRNLAQAVKP